MPWTSAEFKKKHMHSASDEEAKVAAKVANETLRRTGNDRKAVIAGIMAVKMRRKTHKHKE